MCSHKLKKLSRRRPKPIRPGAQLISAEHLWKAFWKRWHDDSRRRSWSHNGVDSVIGNDVHCRARVYELRIVVVDSPLLLMIIITGGVEVIIRVVPIIIAVIPLSILRFSMSHEDAVTARER